MKKLLLLIVLVFAGLVLYGLVGPAPIDPVTYQIEAQRAATGVLAQNNRLADAELIGPLLSPGPEDIAFDKDGWLYTGTEGGVILRMRPDGSEQSEFARVEGRPLGLAFDRWGELYVAVAGQGLMRLDPSGEAELLATDCDGIPFSLPNEVCIARDGTVYLTDSYRRKPDAAIQLGGLFEILEHRGTGRVCRYDPRSKSTETVMDGIVFANGVALSPDEDYLLVSELGKYRILRHWLAGPKTEETEIFVDGLPGFPDNLSMDAEGRTWVALFSPRLPLIEQLSNWPSLRRLLTQLPTSLMADVSGPQPRMICTLDSNGEIIDFLMDSDAQLPGLTTAIPFEEHLYVGFLTGEHMRAYPCQR